MSWGNGVRAVAAVGNAIADAAVRLGEAVGAIALVVILGASLFEIFARKLGAPTLWSRDVTIYGLVALAFLTLAAVERHREHMNVDFVVARFPFRLRKAVELCVGGISLAFVLLIGWEGLLISLDSFRLGRGMTGGITVPAYLPQLMLPVGAFLFALEQVRGLVRLAAASPEQAATEATSVDPMAQPT
jgi:TRAP-type C4-dicarboxylate transport system permease small subunit